MLSEFRYHITTGEWVLFAPKRNAQQKPNDFKKEQKEGGATKSNLSKCPFENPQKSGNDQPYFFFSPDKKLSSWTLQVLPNKFPALSPDYLKTTHKTQQEVSRVADGIGYHDLIITRAHDKPFSLLSSDEAADVLRAYALRCRAYAQHSWCSYVSLFHNWGMNAGASLRHPHYQMIALPIVPCAVERTLAVSKKYHLKHRRCVHCDVIRSEITAGHRIIAQDSRIIAYAPFASKEPYQITIIPKKHCAFFEDESDALLIAASKMLSGVLGALNRALDNPDLNFFIHTAPLSNKKSRSHYHWHIDIVPKLNVSAGFELGTGVEINPVFPEVAAKELKKHYRL